MSPETWIHTMLFGRLVGRDEYGNRYYEGRFAPKEGRNKRWVLYKGIAEPSKVPAHWHGWLHYTLDNPPPSDKVKKYSWQKDHIPNLTGTVNAYVPPGHILRGGARQKTVSDYQPWTPK